MFAREQEEERELKEASMEMIKKEKKRKKNHTTVKMRHSVGYLFIRK